MTVADGSPAKEAKFPNIGRELTDNDLVQFMPSIMVMGEKAEWAATLGMVARCLTQGHSV